VQVASGGRQILQTWPAHDTVIDAISSTCTISELEVDLKCKAVTNRLEVTAWVLHIRSSTPYRTAEFISPAVCIAKPSLTRYLWAWKFVGDTDWLGPANLASALPRARGLLACPGGGGWTRTTAPGAFQSVARKPSYVSLACPSLWTAKA